MTSPDLWEKISNGCEENIFPNVHDLEGDVFIRDIGKLYKMIIEQECILIIRNPDSFVLI